MSHIRSALSRTNAWDRATKLNKELKFEWSLHKLGMFPLKSQKTKSLNNSSERFHEGKLHESLCKRRQSIRITSWKLNCKVPFSPLDDKIIVSSSHFERRLYVATNKWLNDQRRAQTFILNFLGASCRKSLYPLGLNLV